jgi:hypothetical protein
MGLSLVTGRLTERSRCVARIFILCRERVSRWMGWRYGDTKVLVGIGVKAPRESGNITWMSDDHRDTL